jgi:hypothetical protein
MTFEVRNGNKTVRSVWRNSATLSESKRDGLAARDTGNNSEALDRAAGCGTAATNAGCGHRRKELKEQRQQGVEVSKTDRNGESSTLRI